MNWKKQLSKFEESKDWISSINFIQRIIENDSNNLDAYLSMNYLLMNLLVEEQYDIDDHDYYAGLLKKYFIESYAKFSNNAEYLFYIGKIACISEWYFDIDIEEAKSMVKKASQLEPNNFLYKWADYDDLDFCKSGDKNKMIVYAKQALSHPEVKRNLESKGSLGKYLWNSLTFWSKEKITN